MTSLPLVTAVMVAIVTLAVLQLGATMQQTAYAAGAIHHKTGCQVGRHFNFECKIVETPSGNINVQGHIHPNGK